MTRLIDAEKVVHEYYKNPSYQQLCKVLNEAPTVKAIPLDKPFCKMVYGDYVCYNREWLMKHLPMELDILQGKAIPIEWIRNYMFRLPDGSGAYECILVMLEDWEKENGTEESNRNI